METDRSSLCGCKGIRTCLKCEKLFDIPAKTFSVYKSGSVSHVYCHLCNKCWPGWDMYEFKKHPEHKGVAVEFDGVFIREDFLSKEEETSLISELDKLPWDLSQSGRRKQNFGPKCNFKKRKLKVGDFNGFPSSTKFIQDRFSDVDLLKNYHTIEQCSLEYDPARGASIDPHIDDCWIWGERIVTVNLLADSVLTLTPFKGGINKYNLDCASARFQSRVPNVSDLLIRIPMPRRSLLVLYGEARYLWEHLIFREDIQSRRVCLAYREFTEEYLPGGTRENEAAEIFEKAVNFW